MMFFFSIFLFLANCVSAQIVSGSNNYNSYNSSTYDVCQIKHTMQHYLQGKCLEVLRPYSNTDSKKFKLRGVLLTENLEAVDNKKTMIFIPGGPGESSGMLRYALNSKDMLNGMVVHMNLNIVMFDPRGTGTSQLDKPAHKLSLSEFNSNLMVDDLKALADEATSKRVILVAHSAGGATALEFARKYPEKIEKIILVSSSISPRNMASLNLKTYLKEPVLWNQFIKNPKYADLPLEDMNEKYLFIENIHMQQVKARIAKKYVDERIQPSVLDFRYQWVQMRESDNDGLNVLRYIEENYQKLKSLDEEKIIVPEALKKLKLTDKDLEPLVFENNEWIKVAIMCGEGLTQSESQLDVFIEGYQMSWFCNNFSVKNELGVKKIDLSNIDTPVLFLAGRKDFVVPASEVEKIVKQLPNAKMVVGEESGHTMFIEEPMVFYNSIESFIQDI